MRRYSGLLPLQDESTSKERSGRADTGSLATVEAASGGSASATKAAAWGEGQVGLGAAVAISEAVSLGTELTTETKDMIRQTAQWFHANPDKSKVKVPLTLGRTPLYYMKPLPIVN